MITETPIYNESYPNTYILISKIKTVKELISYIKTTRICSFDFETTSLDMFDESQDITTISISFQPYTSYVIPLFHKDSPFTREQALRILQELDREVFTNTKIIKIAHNMKFEHKWLKRYGCELQGILMDSMIAKFYLDENTPMGLKEITSMVMPDYAGYEDEVTISKKKYGGWADIPLDVLAKYNALDSDITLRIMLYFHKKLIAADKKGMNFYKLFRNLRMMASKTLAETEFHGIRVNTEYLDKLVIKYRKLIAEQVEKMENHPVIRRYQIAKRKEGIKQLRDEVISEIKELQETFYKAKADDYKLIRSLDTKIRNRENKLLKINAQEFSDKVESSLVLNFNSPKQLIELFFTSPKGFNFPIIDKTPTGNISTSEGTLLKLQNKDKTGFIKLLLDLRGLEKLNSTYIEGMYKNIDKNGYVHSSYMITGTVTHRLSSRGPNMQNIPRYLTNPDIRRMFEPPEGFLQNPNDYGQAELRVAAELSKDAAMIDIFKRGYNLHVATAVKVITGSLERYDEVREILKDENHTENEYWERQKKKAKQINFGILYGQGDEKLAEGMGVSVNEATEFKQQWFETYPQLTQWIRAQVRKAKRDGFVKSIWGYKRRLPDINNSYERGKQMESERQSVNAPIQGAASDYTLFSAIIHRRDRIEGKLPNYLVLRLIVHDDAGYYIKPEDALEIIPKLRQTMAEPPTKKYFGFEMVHVQMKASSEVGANLGEVHDFKEDKTSLEELWKIHNERYELINKIKI